MLARRLSVNTNEYWHLPWEERLDHLTGHFGFQSLEISMRHDMPDEQFQWLRERLKQMQIAVTAGHEWYHFFKSNKPEDIRLMQERFIRNIERTHALGAKFLIWYTGENESLTGELAVEALIERLQPMLKVAANLDVSLLLETEFSPNGTDPGASLELLVKFMQDGNHPQLGINYDAANVYLAGHEAYPMGYEILKPWIRHVHLKDLRLVAPGQTPPAHAHTGHGIKGYCCPLGEGAVNFYGILQRLKQDGYQGPLTLEAHVPRDQCDQTLARSIAFVQQFMD